MLWSRVDIEAHSFVKVSLGEGVLCFAGALRCSFTIGQHLSCLIQGAAGIISLTL